MRRYRTWSLLLVLCLTPAVCGCASSAAIRQRIERIRLRHGVTVTAPNPLSRCYLFGNLPALLDRIDADLDAAPPFFKQHIGPVVIEESYLDNPATYPFPLFMRGYVDTADTANRHPIHIKNRSLLEKVLLFAPRDGELFLHEATHSFEMNIRREEPGMWLAFVREFRRAQPQGEGRSRFAALGCSLAVGLVPPLGYLRPRGMPSLYATMGHYEDVAETHCYLRRHTEGLGALRRSDPVLYAKCAVLERFTAGAIAPVANDP